MYAEYATTMNNIGIQPLAQVCFAEREREGEKEREREREQERGIDLQLLAHAFACVCVLFACGPVIALAYA